MVPAQRLVERSCGPAASAFVEQFSAPKRRLRQHARGRLVTASDIGLAGATATLQRGEHLENRSIGGPDACCDHQ
jgi:hypothetical protein